MGVLANAAFTAFSSALVKIEAITQAFEENIMDERLFAIIQSAKIIHIAGYATFQDFLSALTLPRQVVNTGGTAPVEYHIFKVAMLGKLEQVLPLVRKHLDDRDFFDEAVIACMSDPQFAAAMERALEVVKKHWNDTEFKELIETGRMSITQGPLI